MFCFGDQLDPQNKLPLWTRNPGSVQIDFSWRHFIALQWPVFHYKEKGQWTGICIELLDALAHRLKFTCVHNWVPRCVPLKVTAKSVESPSGP